MIRTTAVSRPLRVGTAAASVIGIALLAGCAGTTEDAAADSDSATGGTQTETDTSAGDASQDGGSYVDGTYTESGSYSTPDGTLESVEVTLTIADDIVTAVEVTGDPVARESQQYQSQFIGGIADEVVGQAVDDISVTRVAGSSLTSGGFTQALDAIKVDATA